MNLWYEPTMPKEEHFDRGAREVSKYMMVRMFESAMPDFKTSVQKTMGAFSANVRETDPAMADHLDNIRLDNESVMEIFYESMEDNEDELQINSEISGDVVEESGVEIGNDSEGYST